MRDARIGSLLESPAGAKKHSQFQAMCQRAPIPALESAEFFGRWWFDPASSQIRLSDKAAGYLQVGAGSHHQLVDGFMAVVLDDLLPLLSLVSSGSNTSLCMDFRVISSVDGVHWLRMRKLPADPRQPDMVSGTVADITPDQWT